MSFTEKVKVVTVSVILTLGLAGLYAWLSQKIIVGADDDAAIMIAGRSLYLGTHTDYQLKADANDPKVLWFANPKGDRVDNRRVYGLESTDANGMVTTYTLMGATKVVVNYTGGDTITLLYDPVMHYINIYNSDKNNPIART